MPYYDVVSRLSTEPGTSVLMRERRVGFSRFVVCVLTSNRRYAAAPGNTLLPRRATGLPHDSAANASAVATIKKSDLVELVNEPLSASICRAIERPTDDAYSLLSDLQPR